MSKSRLTPSFSITAGCLLLVLGQSGLADHKLKDSKAEVERANHASANAVVSVDGRFVAFHSAADNLVPNDTNQKQDVFVYDREKKTMERVSVSSDGTQGDQYSVRASISGDGRYVAFMSLADNLVKNDSNSQLDVFVHDRKKKTTELVSVTPEGVSGRTRSLLPTISTDGCYVAFVSHANNLVPNDKNVSPDIFVRNIIQGKTELVSVNNQGEQANSNSGNPAISADGRYVVFDSPARNMVPNDTKENNRSEWNFSDVFLRDRKLGTTELISLNTKGAPANHPSGGPSVSADGRYVAFQSSATDLVEGYPTDKITYGGGEGNKASRIDIYVRDRKTGKTELVSVAADGSGPGDQQSQAPKISSDGRFVSFQSAARNLTESRMPGTTINIFQRDLKENKTRVVTMFDGKPETNVMAAHSSISQHGNFVVFDSNYGHQGKALARHSDVYLWNGETGKVELISMAMPGIDKAGSKQASK